MTVRLPVKIAERCRLESNSSLIAKLSRLVISGFRGDRLISRREQAYRTSRRSNTPELPRSM